MGRRCKTSFSLSGGTSLSELISSGIADGSLSEGDVVRVDHRVNGALYTWFVIVDPSGKDRLFHEPEDGTLFVEWKDRTVAVLNHGRPDSEHQIAGADDDGRTYSNDDFVGTFVLSVAENPFFYSVQELEGAMLRIGEMRTAYREALERIEEKASKSEEFGEKAEEETDRLINELIREAVREGLVSENWLELSQSDSRAAIEGLFDLDSELLSGIIRDSKVSREELYRSLLQFDQTNIDTVEKVGYDLAVQKAFLEKAGLTRESVSSILSGSWREHMSSTFGTVPQEQRAIEEGYSDNARKALSKLMQKGAGTYRLLYPIAPYDYVPKNGLDVMPAYMYPVTHVSILANGTVCVGRTIDGQAVFEPIQNFIDKIFNDNRLGNVDNMSRRYQDIASSKQMLFHELTFSIVSALGIGLSSRETRERQLDELMGELIRKTRSFADDPNVGLSLIEREWSSVIRGATERLWGHHLAEYMSMPPLLEGKERANAAEALILTLTRLAREYGSNVWVDGKECQRMGYQPSDDGVACVKVEKDGSYRTERYFNLNVFPRNTELLPRKVLARYNEKYQLNHMLTDAANLKLYHQAMERFAARCPKASALSSFLASVYLGSMSMADVFFDYPTAQAAAAIEYELVDNLSLDETAKTRESGISVFYNVIQTASVCREIAREMHLESRIGQRCEAAREEIAEMDEEQMEAVEREMVGEEISLS